MCIRVSFPSFTGRAKFAQLLHLSPGENGMPVRTILALCLTLFMNLAHASDADEKAQKNLWILINAIDDTVKTDLTVEQFPEFAQGFIDLAGGEDFLKVGVNTAYVEYKVKKRSAKLMFYRNFLGRNYEAIEVKIKRSRGVLKADMKFVYKHAVSLYRESEAEFDAKSLSSFRKNMQAQLKGLISEASETAR
jgi:opacity protein-like surface antigen